MYRVVVSSFIVGMLFVYGISFANAVEIASTTTVSVPILDSDHDGLSDQQELELGTDMHNVDTDGDGYPDGTEVRFGFNPLAGGRDRKVERAVEVDLHTQTLKYYLNNVEVGTIPVSTGILRWPTPDGDFKVQRKVAVKRYTGANYDYPNTKWNIQFKPGFYLHGAYWHNQFGIRPMSHGCVNIATENAEKLFYFLDVGDSVKVVGKTPLKSLLLTKK